MERVVCVWEYVDRSRAFSSVERLSILLEFRLGDYSIYLAMIGTEINTMILCRHHTHVLLLWLELL